MESERALGRILGVLYAVTGKVAPAAFVHLFEHGCDGGFLSIEPSKINVADAAFDHLNFVDCSGESTMTRCAGLGYGKGVWR